MQVEVANVPTAVQQARKVKKMTISRVANDLQMNQGTYWRIEAGVTSITAPAAHRISRYFGVSVNKLFQPDRFIASEVTEEI